MRLIVIIGLFGITALASDTDTPVSQSSQNSLQIFTQEIFKEYGSEFKKLSIIHNPTYAQNEVKSYIQLCLDDAFRSEYAVIQSLDSAHRANFKQQVFALFQQLAIESNYNKLSRIQQNELVGAADSVVEGFGCIYHSIYQVKGPEWAQGNLRDYIKEFAYELVESTDEELSDADAIDCIEELFKQRIRTINYRKPASLTPKD